MSALSDRNGADARRTNCGEVTTKRTAGEVNGENRFAPNSAKRSRKSGTNLYHAPSLQRIRKHSLLPPTRPHNLPPLSTDPSLRSRFGRASVALRSRFGRGGVRWGNPSRAQTVLAHTLRSARHVQWALRNCARDGFPHQTPSWLPTLPRRTPLSSASKFRTGF